MFPQHSRLQLASLMLEGDIVVSVSNLPVGVHTFSRVRPATSYAFWRRCFTSKTFRVPDAT
jgi:hypothetical protein